MNFVDPMGTNSLLCDFLKGAKAHGEGIGTALAHLSARTGLLGPEAEAYADRLETIMGLGMTAATYAPEEIFKPGEGNNMLKQTWNSSGALPDFAREHPGFMGGRFASGATLSVVLSSPIGLSITALSMYGSGIQAVQRGESFLRGAALGY